MSEISDVYHLCFKDKSKNNGILNVYEKIHLRNILRQIQGKVICIKKVDESPLKYEDSEECYGIVHHFICMLPDSEMMSFMIASLIENRLYEEMDENIWYSLEELGLWD